MIQSALQSLPPDRRAMLHQLIRYALAGFAITVAVAGSYWAITDLGSVDPMVSFTIVFLVFSAISYFTHGEFSFRGHGQRDRHHVRMGRFFAVNLLGYLVNQGFIWLLVKQLGGPTWWPTLPMLFVTPLLTFALHRRFVYA
ncbi:GtrA family protein [Sphingomonas xanthus]|uniref:GtrA family protein n=1 Tax=Sphingomonas xanthus TaxID=2594473 RepID=A0A516IRB2_9SPHN|nr:GtrA family protein [Sphingomonas xanthus]QDP19453.1 GtrA family protein [Sphingomonas xanthus]